jgi:hypothetical protein
MTNLRLIFLLLGAMLLVGPETIYAQCGTGCQSCRSNCNSQHLWVINGLEQSKGQCQLFAARDRERCDYDAGQDYISCMSNFGDVTFCWSLQSYLQYLCFTAFLSEVNRCNALYDPFIQDAQRALNECLSDCERIIDTKAALRFALLNDMGHLQQKFIVPGFHQSGELACREDR